MNITSDTTTKMVPQKTIRVNIELTEDEAATFIDHYGSDKGCSHQVTKALFNEISGALAKQPVDDTVVVTNPPQRPYPPGTRVKVCHATKPWVGWVVIYDRLHCWYEVRDENGGIGAYDPQDIEAI